MKIDLKKIIEKIIELKKENKKLKKENELLRKKYVKESKDIEYFEDKD